MGVRAFVFLTTLGLLVAPGILAPPSEGPVVHHLASFASGDRFVYDTTLVVGVGAAREAWTAESQLGIEVGEPAERRLLDGASLKVLPITMTRASAPWDGIDADDRHFVQNGTEAPDDRPSSGELLLALDGGAVVGRRAHHTGGEVVIHREEGNLVFPEYTSEQAPIRLVVVERPMAPVPLFASGARPGIAFTENTTAEGEGAPDLPVARKGLFDGRLVYDLGTEADRGGGPFDCPTPAPALPWEEAWTLPALGDRTDAPIITMEPLIETWVHPDIPLPVLMVCRTNIETTDGRFSTPVTVAWSLRAHERGAAPVEIDWDGLAMHPSHGPRATRETPHLYYPLDAALNEVRGRLRDVEPGFGPRIAVERAEYWPNHIGKEPQSDAERTLDVIGQAAATEPTVDAEPIWKFVLTNATGHSLVARTYRVVYDEGGLIEQWTKIGRPQPPADLAQAMGGEATADQLLSPLPHSLAAFGLTGEEWQEQQDAGLRYERRSGSPTGPVLVTMTGHDDGEIWWPYREQGRRTEDSALIEERRVEPAPHATRAEDDGPRPSSATVPSVVPVPSGLVGVAVKGGAAFGLLLLLVYFWDALKALLVKGVLFPLYGKLRKDRLLDHQKRDEILRYVRGNPGTYKSEIRRMLGIGLGTATHHLDVLERNGLLISVRSGRRRCYFVRTADGKGLRALRAVLSSDATRRVYRSIEGTPGIKQKALAACLGVSQTAVIFHVRKLIEVGAVHKERAGREVVYRIAPVDGS